MHRAYIHRYDVRIFNRSIISSLQIEVVDGVQLQTYSRNEMNRSFKATE